MSAATVSAQLARLDAISRTRALTKQESWALQKMLSTQRRYDRRRSLRSEVHE